MRPIRIRDEFQTTAQRIWDIFFDPEFVRQLAARLRLQREIYEFEDTPEQLRMVYKVVAHRAVPDWIRRVMGDVKVTFVATDVYDKKTHRLSAQTRDVAYGNWTVTEIRPGWVSREFYGELTVDVPLIGGKIAEKVGAGLESDFAMMHVLLREWIQRDLTALAAGQPLPALNPPSPE